MRQEREKKGKLIYFALYRETGIHIAAYTHKCLAPSAPLWLHPCVKFLQGILPSSYTLPTSFFFPLFPVAPSSTRVFFSSREQRPLPPYLLGQSAPVLLYPLSRSSSCTLFAFSATTLTIQGTAGSVSDVSSILGEQRKESFNFFRGSRSDVRSLRFRKRDVQAVLAAGKFSTRRNPGPRIQQ